MSGFTRGDKRQLDHVERRVRKHTQALMRRGAGTSDVVAHVVRLADSAVRQLQPERNACRPGCGWCCHEPVAVSPAEAIFIALQMRWAMSDADLEAAKVELRRAAAQAARYTSLQAFREAHVRCAFLTAEQECAIYQARPMMCRAYSSLDADACRSSYERPGDVDVPTNMTAAVAVVAIGAGMRRAFAAARMDDRHYELADAVLRVLEQPEVAARWRDGEDAFLGVRDALGEHEVRAMGL